MLRNQDTALFLQSQLLNFGLNPAEWTLNRLHSVGYLIEHRYDTNFKFIGKYEFKARRPRWKTVELFSI